MDQRGGDYDDCSTFEQLVRPWLSVLACCCASIAAIIRSRCSVHAWSRASRVGVICLAAALCSSAAQSKQPPYVPVWPSAGPGCAVLGAWLPLAGDGGSTLFVPGYTVTRSPKNTAQCALCRRWSGRWSWRPTMALPSPSC